MTVMVVKRSVGRELADRLGLAFMGDMSQIDEVLAKADFVSIHLPLESGTVGFFGAREFSKMKTNAILINIARAPIVDKKALCDSLANRRLGGAGLDVYWDEPADPADPLLALPNVFLTPHVAGATDEVKSKVASVTAENIKLVLAGKAPRFEVFSAPH
jgi:phosphoglycerate dehydrogenase-like enzyme